MLWIGLLFCLALGSIVDPTLFQLGSNLVKNHNFMDPVISVQYKYVTSMAHWNCNPDCQMVKIELRCIRWNNPCSISFDQGIDLDQDDSHFSLSQGIPITTEGQYLLRMTYMPPSKNPIGKAVHVSINGTQVGTFTSTDDIYIDHIYEVLVNLTVGTAALSITNGGVIDRIGIELGVVELRELIPVVSPSALLGPFSDISYLLLDNFTRIMNQFPGNRIFF